MANDPGSVLLTGDLERAWSKRHAEISESQRLAGLFRGWKPEGFAESRCRVLYVGKATSGPFDGVEPERQHFNESKTSAFWIFARELAVSIGCDDESLPCIAWSNLSKISLPQIKAESKLTEDDKDLAAKTLEAEVGSTKPHVVVFVVHHFQDEVVRQVAQGPSDMDWNRSENESTDVRTHDVWWKRRQDGVAVLWMRHPERAKTEKRSFAAAKVAALVGQVAECKSS